MEMIFYILSHCQGTAPTSELKYRISLTLFCLANVHLWTLAMLPVAGEGPVSRFLDHPDQSFHTDKHCHIHHVNSCEGHMMQEQ